MSDYITISQYAEIKGITKQAVYKQLKNKLKEFLIVVDGVKHIDIAALSDVEISKLNEVEQPVNQLFNNQIQPLLETQIAEKDKVIESLLRQVENLQEQNSKLTELLHNSQVLLAAEKKFLIEENTPIEEKQEEKKSIFSRFKRNKNK